METLAGPVAYWPTAVNISRRVFQCYCCVCALVYMYVLCIHLKIWKHVLSVRIENEQNVSRQAYLLLVERLLMEATATTDCIRIELFLLLTVFLLEGIVD